MSSHDQQEPVSSPRSTSEVSADIRKLGISGRSASPAKRTYADSQDDGDDEALSHVTEQDSNRLLKYNGAGIKSPMPSRHKPMPSIEVNDQAYQETIENVENDMKQEEEEKTLPIVHGQAEDLPSLDEQVRKITEITNTSEQKDGQKGYAIAINWLNRVVSRTTERMHEGFPKELREGDIGPVDNSSIVANGKLPVPLRFVMHDIDTCFYQIISMES